MGLLTCLAYIGYSFFNMTEQGLLNSLTILGISLILDLAIIRPVFIMIISFITIRRQKANLVSNKVQDEEQLALLGTLYETYEQPANMMMP